jgi:hypothetical protein
MNDGVKILLARMETHPEEFIAGEGKPYIFGNGSKWGSLIMQYRDYLDEEDKKMLDNAVNKINQQEFTERVMQELLDPHEDAQQELSLNPYNVTGSVTSGNVTITSCQTLPSSITYTSEPLVNKKPTTTGKLFNYT